MGPIATLTARSADVRMRDDTVGLFAALLGPPREWTLRIRTWDGATHGPPDAPATLVLEHPWSARAMLWPPSEVSAGEAYIFGDIDFEGDLETVFTSFARIRDFEWSRPGRSAHVARLLLRLPAPPRERDADRAAELGGDVHSVARDRAAVRYHYDVSNDFFSMWLDDRMQYSCAYFHSPVEGLEEAQTAKLEHICRKLRIAPGDRLLDIGCGWGGLLEHAAARHGAVGLGITLSEPQAEHANRRLEDAGLSEAVRVEVCDYREADGPFDKIVSVGMVEHVGAARLPEYFDHVSRLLAPRGVFLNHGIATAWHNQPALPKDGFAHRYVFPDGELVPLSTMLEAAERAGFEVRDVESLREHYAHTLRHWVRRLEDRHEEVVGVTDETTYRIWRLYMAASAHGFDAGLLSVFQALLQRPDSGPSGLPLTREDWYRSRD